MKRKGNIALVDGDKPREQI